MFIDSHLTDRGVPPSYEEMKTAIRLKSKSGIHRLIKGLEERGFIRRLPHKARALEVIRRPPNVIDGPPLKNAFQPKIVDSSFYTDSSKFAESPKLEENSIELPFYGKIAAGTPIEALRDDSRTYSIPPAMLTRGEHYTLEIEGNSMVDAGILDGDIVLIQRADTANNGEIVVALVNGQEATLKRLRRRGNSIALEPANSQHETRIFGPDQVKVQGRLVGLVRSY
tara:strand:+ start:1441 stop:2115 length:675 start_codon:yes stop_codon:yes gene_type:complete